jgi:hypothetical protein
VGFVGILNGCTPPAVKFEFKVPTVTIPDLFGSSRASAESGERGSTDGVFESDTAVKADPVAGSIIGAEYSLDTWSVEEIKARLQRNQREFDHVVGHRKELAGVRWESPARSDVLEFLDSEDLRSIQRLNLEGMQLAALLSAHRVRESLRLASHEAERELGRLERDGVDSAKQARLRKQLEGVLRPQLQRVGVVMLAGSVGTPPLGATAATITPIAYGQWTGPVLVNPNAKLEGFDAGSLIRGFDGWFSGGRAAALLLWPSGLVYPGTPGFCEPRKPAARTRVLIDQAGEAAASYSKLLAEARAEQQAYFRECMELCERIEGCARAGDDGGVDAARAEWIQAALGGLFVPMQESPDTKSEQRMILGQTASPVSAVPNQGAAAQPAAVPDAPGLGTLKGMNFQDYEAGVAMVVDLDALAASSAASFLESRRDAARKRYAELAAVHPTTSESMHEMQSMFLHDQLAQDLLWLLQHRERDRAELQRLREEIDGRTSLGVELPEYLRKQVERLEKQLSDGRIFTLWRTCNEFSRKSFPSGHVFGNWKERTAGRGELERLWDAQMRCLFGPTEGAGVRPMKALASQYGDAAARLKADSEGPVRWLVGESRFYERIVTEIDALRTKKEATETSQYREAARRIDAELRARCELMCVGFFEPIPGLSNP